MARRILLADDSVTAQNMGRRILADAGYEVVTVNNGSAALKKIAENNPDIIVLDVYMPGYGGLEVCQRVKQSPDTARIPVLLTVGKLEPFKPEEARRVGADAFIIKPFEATELLTALTKLEDKIVAGPQPQKSGRFARALAAVEQSAGERFGDKETGWKNRLTIPGPNARPPQETEAPETFAGPARDFDRSEAPRPVEAKQEFERPIPAGLPPDITPEEIAAITAAAASFDGKAGNPVVIPEGSASESAASMQAASAETVAVSSSEPEVPAATLASRPESESESAALGEVAAEATPVAPEAVSEAIASSEAPPLQEQAAAIELPAPVAEAVGEPPATSETEVHQAEKSSRGDDEVMAAIASLAPSNGHGSEAALASEANGTNQEVSVAASSAVAVEAVASGPRWIAESVAVALEESAPTLEQEMEVAAARIAAEAARNELPTATAVEVQAAAPAVEAAESTVSPEVSVTEAVAATEPVPAPSVAAESTVAANAVAESAAAESVVAASSCRRERCCRRRNSRECRCRIVPRSDRRARRAERRSGIRSGRGGRSRLGTRLDGGSGSFRNGCAGDIRDRTRRKCRSHATARGRTGCRLAKLEADSGIVCQHATSRSGGDAVHRSNYTAGRGACASGSRSRSRDRGRRD